MSLVFCKPATAPPPLSLSSASSFLLKQVAQPLNGGEEEEGEMPSKESPVLKRKRPARIDIPVTSLRIEKAKTTSVFSKRGKKSGVLEDRYAAVLGVDGDSKQVFFGVFDGHGGAGAAEFASTLTAADSSPFPSLKHATHQSTPLGSPPIARRKRRRHEQIHATPSTQIQSLGNSLQFLFGF